MVDFLRGLHVDADNQGPVELAKNPVLFHDRSKNIDVQYRYTRSLVKAGRISLDYVPTKEVLADLLINH